MSAPSIIQPQITIDENLKESAIASVEEESQVIVHCYYPESPFGSKLRIWPSTYLIDQHSNHRSSLLLVHNISIMPQWTYIKAFQPHRFTLYFAGLPRQCTAFDLVEEIPEPGAFIVKDIQRNNEDVYHLYLE